ncbi:MAG: type II toxin-antitoxin system RelE/ParE family toxin [Candidatus Diapherotrites archaeon]
MFELLVTKGFSSELKKFENIDVERIKKKLILAAEQPQLFFERLTGHDLFKLRVGKYRIICQINFIQKKITAITVAHRKKVYRKI